jgi:hypothetical protein
VALLRAAIEAYEVEAQIERKRFYSAAARGRPEAGAGSGQRLELRQGRRAWPLEVHRLAPDRFRVSVEGRRIEVRIEPVEDAPLLERRARGSEWRLHCGDRSFRVLSVAEGLEHRVEVEVCPTGSLATTRGVVARPPPSWCRSTSRRDEVATGDRLLSWRP